jgi:uncharacterized membrane protein
MAASPADVSVESTALITNDAVVFGILALILAFLFKTASSQTPFWRKFYTYVPMLLLCYFLPSLLNTFGLVDGDKSRLYFVASRYLLPASLVLLTLSIDMKEIIKLGPKALVMFFTGTVGVIIGGPLAILITSTFAPQLVGGVDAEAVWRGMTTVAGSWIGGGANQAAMFEVFQPSKELFSVMVTVDVLVAEVWLFFILYGIGQSAKIDKFLKADNSSIIALRDKMEHYIASISRVPLTADLMMIVGIAFTATGVSHYLADTIAPWIAIHAPQLKTLSLDSSFFWLILLATTFGLGLSFTKFRSYEGAGASKVGSLFIYILVATIGMQMDVTEVVRNPGLFLVGLIWMGIHVAMMIAMAIGIRAPFFFLAVGSTANIGGAASAPVVAAGFHPSLAPVGVLLAVLGYAVGTYGAWICGILMEIAAVGI